MYRRRKKTIKSKENIIYKRGLFYFSENKDIYSEEKKEGKINLILQYYIPKDDKRRKEIDYVLKKNIKNDKINKIYLLNEKKYENILEPKEKIIQIIINERLTFKKAFEFIKEQELGYYILLNSDIYFDESIENIKYGSLSLYPCMQALLRYEDDTKKLFGIRNDSQDSWILHNKFLKNNEKPYDNMDFHLGVGGCDNAIVHRFHELGFKIFNEPYKIKGYHCHSNKERKWISEEKVSFPYLYPKPIIL